MEKYRQRLTERLRKVLPEGKVALATPPDPAMGDLALPCFALAKALRRNPAEIAADLAERLEPPEFIERIEAKGPYLNFFIHRPTLVRETLRDVREQGDAYGSSVVGGGRRVLIEHTSINPNASPHVGRARNAFIGDVLVRLFRFEGYEVEVQYFVNDAGKQIAMLVLGAEGHTDLAFDDLLGLYSETARRVEADPDLERRVFALLRRFEEGDEETRAKFRRVVETCLKGQVALFEELGIRYDVFQYESEYLWNGRTEAVLQALAKTGRLFEDAEGRRVLNQEGFDLPVKSPVLVLARADGTSLYPLRDLAYTLDKVRAGAERNIIVLGEDQKTYFRQLAVALEMLGAKAPEAVHYSFVLLTEGKMSTRKGQVVLLEDFMREAVARARRAIAERHGASREERARDIAYGAVKYAILKVANNRNVRFDWNEALAFEGDTGPYLQYSHARICSIFRKYGKPLPAAVDGALLLAPVEVELVKSLARFPSVVLQSSETLSAHILTNYAYDLARAFSTFYHECPVLNADTQALGEARLALIDAVRQVIRNTLSLLGIEPVEAM